MNNLKKELETELVDNILKYWVNHAIDEENGGFYGYISAGNEVCREHFKTSIITSRILWTFSKAYSVYKNNDYKKMADIAYNYLKNHFYDSKNGGVYWSVDYKGQPLEKRKQTYAQVFYLYGLSEYYQAFGEGFSEAEEMFSILENNCRDKEYGGYFDGFSEEWGYLSNSSLSEKDMNVPKTMNTNLHVLEAYTNFYRINKNEEVKKALQDIILIASDKIIENNSFKMYFKANWSSLSDMVSYGHDIEGSWLLLEAAEVLGEKELLAKIKNLSVSIAEAVYNNGVDFSEGGIIPESRDGKIVHENKEWWTAAEAVVGFYNAYQLTDDPKFLNITNEIWEFIKTNYVDKENGEWFFNSEKSHTDEGEKVGPWKCPYHNSRMCFEIVYREGKVHSV